jgi:NAD(P)-dependent dehydrogenase (short-subunit alcohol dehydrogenase family)
MKDIERCELSLKNKVAVITGGTSGIGGATAKLFAQAGATVVIAGRNKDKGIKIIDEINNHNRFASFITYDARNEESIKNVIAQTIVLYGRIDILFNNAGILKTGALEELGKDMWEEIFSINITSCYLFTKYAMPHLIEAKGVILNNASTAGLHVRGRSYAYSASKSAMIQFSYMCARNYGKDVRVNCICPGVIDTPLYTDRNLDRYIENIPLKRIGTPEEVAKVALFLCSDYASYLNGVILTVDGGFSL